MKQTDNHFKITKLNNRVFSIQENISEIHPIYRNDPLNLYIVLGSKRAILLDTGCGLYPLKPIVKDIIEGRELIVINSHAHWDHILGNHEFEEVYIHKNEANIIKNYYNLTFLRNSPRKSVKKYEKYNFLIPPADKILNLHDRDIFDLGDLNVEIIHAPGHSLGSICLKTNNILFTGDVAYYGDIFLPPRSEFPIVLKTLSDLINISEKYEDIILFPSHCKSPCSIKLLKDLMNEIKSINKNWELRIFDNFFDAWRINSKNFTFIISEKKNK